MEKSNLEMAFVSALQVIFLFFFNNWLGIFYSPKLFEWKIEIWFIVETLSLMEDKFKSVRKYFGNKFCTAIFWDNNKTCTNNLFMHFLCPVHYRQWFAFSIWIWAKFIKKGNSFMNYFMLWFARKPICWIGCTI